MTQTETTSKRIELPVDLLERVDTARGAQSRADWLAQAVDQKLNAPDLGPVLDLDVLPERDRIKFRGKEYELRHIDEMGIVEQRKMNKDGQEFGRLFNSADDLTDDQDERMLMLRDRVFHLVLDAPVGVRSEFTDGQRTRTVLAFTSAPARKQLAQAIENILRQQQEEGVAPALTS